MLEILQVEPSPTTLLKLWSEQVPTVGLSAGNDFLRRIKKKKEKKTTK